MIYEQYYTRDRRGVFSKTPGYDTVARSSGLDDDFILNTLHNLCFYSAPQSLAGEQEKNKYPKSLFYVNTEDGRTVIGQSIFAGKDYTKERFRYFTHCYVISDDNRKKYIEDPDNIIYAAGFKEDYDIEMGSTIESVLQIKVDKSLDVFGSFKEMLKAASIDRTIFINMIKACFDAASFNKRIYIILDFNENTDKIERGILKYIYRSLPLAVRKKVGFITYVKQPEIKDLIHIEFIHSEGAKKSTRWIKSGYVFDIPNQKFYIDGIDEKEHAFIDFVMNNIEDKKTLSDFFHNAEDICNGGLKIDEYDDILLPNRRNKESASKSKSQDNPNLNSEGEKLFDKMYRKFKGIFKKK